MDIALDEYTPGPLDHLESNPFALAFATVRHRALALEEHGRQNGNPLLSLADSAPTLQPGIESADEDCIWFLLSNEHLVVPGKIPHRCRSPEVVAEQFRLSRCVRLIGKLVDCAA